jgi:hypothetical protein
MSREEHPCLPRMRVRWYRMYLDARARWPPHRRTPDCRLPPAELHLEAGTSSFLARAARARLLRSR